MTYHSSTAEVLDDHDDDTPVAEPLGLAPDVVEVRRNAGLAAFVGAVASAVAIAYLARATSTGASLDWVLAGAMGLLGIGYLAAFVDARTPLLVADAQGVRIRLGQSWRGLPWGALRQVEHRRRRGLLRDGRLVLVVHNPERLVEELDRSGRRQSRVSRRLYGAPFAVPLALSTRVSGAGDDLNLALTRLAGDAVPVVDVLAAEAEAREVEGRETEARQALEEQEADAAAAAAEVAAPAASEPPADELAGDVEDSGTDQRRRWLHPRPLVAHAINVVAGRLQRPTDEGTDEAITGDDHSEHTDATDDVEQARNAAVVASQTPSPLREPVAAARAEVRRDLDDGPDEIEGRELRRPGSVNLVEDTVVWGERVSPISRGGSAVEPLLIDEFAVEPAEDPVVGPELVAARTRLGLTVDQLSDRTRIRPHVIESIEVDDFAPCGGDFYARGHLRTLARVLGIDVAPLLTRYDDRYADAPINPRRVFEAELATGAHGSIRGTRGGPNWSVLIAVVMTLVLAWSVARLIMDSPVELRGTTPILNGSAGVSNGSTKLAPPVPVELTAAGGGAHVVVRDGSGTVVFNGNLAFGQTKVIKVSPPVRVQSSDGSLEATIDGEPRGALGATGQPAQNPFPVT